MKNSIRNTFALLATPLLLTACLAEPDKTPEKPPFSFETASLDEQTAWLTEEADELAKGFSKGLNAAYTQFRVEPPKILVKGRKITIVANSLRNDKLTITGGQQQKLQKAICEDYARSKLGKHGVLTTFIIKRPNGSIATILKDGKAACRSYVKTPAQ